jgi:hypothetical protein
LLTGAEPEKAALKEIVKGTGCTPTPKIICGEAFDPPISKPTGRPTTSSLN